MISIIATASLTVNLTTLGKILIARYMHVSNPINSNIYFSQGKVILSPRFSSSTITHE